MGLTSAQRYNKRMHEILEEARALKTDTWGTRAGMVHYLYGEMVERRPFSRFTGIKSQQDANAVWVKLADAWGDEHIDEHGKVLA